MEWRRAGAGAVGIGAANVGEGVEKGEAGNEGDVESVVGGTEMEIGGFEPAGGVDGGVDCGGHLLVSGAEGGWRVVDRVVGGIRN